MSTLAPRRLSRKALHNLAAIVAVGGVSAVLAAPAMAAPFDTVAYNSAANEFQFGDTCTAGAAPVSSGDEVNWRENLVNNTVSIRLQGNHCLQNTTATARVSIEYYDNAHALLGRYNSLPATGNGGALNQFSVDREGPRLSSAIFNHAHIQEQELVGGVWTNVPGAVELVNYP
jgi:hypothetical protein